MDITFLTEYISPISLIVCLVLGFIIKSCTDSPVVHNLIPCIVAVVGVVICVWDMMEFTPGVLAAGLISGLASTGLYEALRNILNLNKEKEVVVTEEVSE